MELELFVDGACSGNPGPGGWAFILIKDKQIIVSKSGACNPTTNNIMELLSIVNGLKFIYDNNLQDRAVRVFSDSAYCVNGLNSWILNWERNGWLTSTKEPVKNKELWQVIQAYSSEMEVSFEKVKGHSNNIYNQMADKLAVEAKNGIRK